jgi:hypothetical protein
MNSLNTCEIAVSRVSEPAHDIEETHLDLFLLKLRRKIDESRLNAMDENKPLPKG